MNLLWYKVTDLRIIDHQALYNSFKGKKNVLITFFLDPRFFENMKFGHVKFDKFKQKFLYESLVDLDNKIRQNNGHLNIYNGKPEDIIPELIIKHNIKNVYYNW